MQHLHNTQQTHGIDKTITHREDTTVSFITKEKQINIICYEKQACDDSTHLLYCFMSPWGRKRGGGNQVCKSTKCK